MKVSCEGYKLSAEDVVYDKDFTETCFTENVLQKLILRYWEMQWNKARFQTHHQGESMLWHESREYRITAWICKSTVIFGGKLSLEASKIGGEQSCGFLKI